MKFRLLSILVLVSAMLWFGFSIRELQEQGTGRERMREATRKALLAHAPVLADEEIDVLVDGRTGVVFGTVSSAGAYGAAAEAIADVRQSGVLRDIGLATLHNGLSQLTVPWIALTQPGPNHILVEGLLPAVAAHRITSHLRSEFPADAVEIVDRIQISDSTYVPAWDETLSALAPVFLKAARGGELRIEDTSATFTGRVLSESARLKVEQAVTRGLGATVNHVFNRLASDPERPEAPACELILSSDTAGRSITLSGRFSTEAIRQSVVAQMRAAIVGDITVRDELQVDPRVPDAWWPTLLGPLVTEYAANPWLKRVRIGEDAVELAGPTLGEEERSRLTALARRVFPEAAYRLDDHLTVDPSAYAALSDAHPEIAAGLRGSDPAPESRPEITPPPMDELAPDAVPREPKRTFSDPPRDESFQTLATAAAAATVYFDFNGARLVASYERDLSRVAACLRVTPDSGIALRAYASVELDPAARARLGAWRCNEITNHLASLGIDPERLSIEPEVRVSAAGNQPPSWRDHRVELVPRRCVRRDGGSDSLPAATDLAATPGLDASGIEPVYFDSNSTDLNAAERRKLDGIAATLLQAREKTIALRGRTDRWGDPELNARLADLRSQSVREYLAGKGIPTDRLAIRPAVVAGTTSNEDNEGQPSWQNRRVEFVLE